MCDRVRVAAQDAPAVTSAGRYQTTIDAFSYWLSDSACNRSLTPAKEADISCVYPLLQTLLTSSDHPPHPRHRRGLAFASLRAFRFALQSAAARRSGNESRTRRIC